MLRFSTVAAAVSSSIIAMMITLFILFASSSPASATVTSSKKLNQQFNHLKDKNGNNKVDTIVHVMLENRAFDHLLGWSGQLLGINGLTGNEYNRMSTLDATSPKVYVDKNAPYIAPLDPDHATYATTSKIYGLKGLLEKNYTETNSGFVEWEVLKHKKSPNTTTFSVMGGFPPERVPTLVNFAQEFSVFDNFFASVPGCTWPNRAYAIMGGSFRNTETYFFYEGVNGNLYPQKTIFDQLEEEGLDWNIATGDVLWENFIAKIAYNPDKVIDLEHFYEKAAKGTLPAYTFINPQGGVNLTSGTGARDCHPDHDVSSCLSFIADLYESVRASPQWNSTMFIFSFDEHGGFYDHVESPTEGVPPPTPGETGIPDWYFKFDRLGVRIPFLVASPWIPKGTVVSQPPASEKPFATSQYDLTSIMATMRKVLGMSSTNLTARDGWSATFSHILSLDEPRTDAPMTLNRTNDDGSWSLQAEAEGPITDLQRDIAKGLHQLTDGVPIRKTGHPKHLKTKAEYSSWAAETWNTHKTHIANHKKGVLHAIKSYETVVTGVLNIEAAVLGEKDFNVLNATQCGQPTRWTIASRTLRDPNTQNPFCLTWNTSAAQATFEPCFPSADPCKNQNVNQQWFVNSIDSSYRPFLDQDFCLTSVPHPTGNPPLIQKCTGNNVLQRWEFNGNNLPGFKVPGESGGGEIMFGDGVFVLFMKPKL